MRLAWYRFTGCEGRLATFCAPGFGVSRDRHLDRLVEEKITAVVNLTTDADHITWFQSQASALTSFYEARGIEEIRHPFLDMSAPSSELAMRIVDDLEWRLVEGHNVGLHCIAGRGRTGLIVACLLVNQGFTPEDAIAEVRRRVPGSIITRPQERAVFDFPTTGSSRLGRLIEEAPC